MSKLKIAHLYPQEMNIYGDRGNIIALVKRLTWRGFKVKVDEVGIGQRYDLRQADILFGGGGQDRGQSVISQDLQKRKQNFHEAIEEGVVALVICGMYQLLGRGFVTNRGQEIPGISIFKAKTVASNHRMIGNIVVSTPYGEMVGFENHSGQTTLEAKQEPLGYVIKGYGNNDQSKQEGAVTNNAFGTYMHGPVLPKNPTFCDELLLRALKRKHGVTELEPLNDILEYHAAEAARKRP